jgi:hypothetical protein
VGSRLAARSRGFLGQLDQAGGSDREATARGWPQSTQIVVPLAGSAAGHWIEGMFVGPPVAQETCSVSRAQPEQ